MKAKESKEKVEDKQSTKEGSGKSSKSVKEVKKDAPVPGALTLRLDLYLLYSEPLPADPSPFDPFASFFGPAKPSSAAAQPPPSIVPLFNLPTTPTPPPVRTVVSP